MNKRLRLGSFTFALGALVLAGAIVFNLLLGALPTTLTHWDLSTNRLFTVDPQTRTILEGLDQKVTVYLVAERDNRDATLLELLERYRQLSPYLTVETVDPVENPAFVTQYTQLAINQNSLIVESQKRYKVIEWSEIYTITSPEYLEYYYAYGEYLPDTFCGEDQLTGAINYVTTDALPVVGLVTGHGESVLSDGILHTMKIDNLDVQTVELLRTGIPQGCRLLILNDPENDLAADEKVMLETFLAQGNRVMLLTGVRADAPQKPNLQALAGAFGLEAVPGILCETDPANYYLSPYFIYPHIQEHPITQPLIQGKYSVYLPNGHGISLKDVENVTQTVLLESESTSFSKTDLKELAQSSEPKPTEKDIAGPLPMAVLAQNTSQKSAFCWIGAVSVVDDEVDPYSGGANLSFFLNAAEWMCGKTDTISIRTQSLTGDLLTMNQQSASLWTGVFCALLPVSLAFCGGWVWWHRRKRL